MYYIIIIIIIIIILLSLLLLYYCHYILNWYLIRMFTYKMINEFSIAIDLLL
jgi:hypothetical protein